MDAELDLLPFDRTGNALTIHIHLHLTNPSRGLSLVSTYSTVIFICFFISVFVATWQVFISSALQASASASGRESWSHRTSEGGSFYGASDREEMEMHEAETENMGRRWAEHEFLARLAERTKSD